MFCSGSMPRISAVLLRVKYLCFPCHNSSMGQCWLLCL